MRLGGNFAVSGLVQTVHQLLDVRFLLARLGGSSVQVAQVVVRQHLMQDRPGIECSPRVAISATTLADPEVCTRTAGSFLPGVPPGFGGTA